MTGPASRSLIKRLAELECPAFRARREQRAGGEHAPESIVLARGSGSTIVDVDGKRYVDLAAGFGAALLGHGHPAIQSAIATQCERLVQGLGDVYASDAKLALLESLVRLHPGEAPQALITQSGGDAVTAALKTVTLKTGRHAIIAFDGAYHGLGYGPLPACGFAKSFREPFAAQLNDNVHFAPYPGVRGADVDASLEFVRSLLKQGDVAAVLVEPVMGRGGCVVPPDRFLTELCDLAHAHHALVIADEVWSGLGRSGAWLRSTAVGANIDVLCLGKGLGGGVPISACIAPAAIMDAWARGGEVVHTSTHAGAPLACAAAHATLQTLRLERLPERAAKVGERAMHHFRRVLDGCDRVSEVRGVGLMIGIELEDAATALSSIASLLERGYLVISGGIDGATLTLTPALTIDEQELMGFGDVLREVLAA